MGMREVMSSHMRFFIAFYTMFCLNSATITWISLSSGSPSLGSFLNSVTQIVPGKEEERGLLGHLVPRAKSDVGRRGDKKPGRESGDALSPLFSLPPDLQSAYIALSVFMRGRGGCAQKGIEGGGGYKRG